MICKKCRQVLMDSFSFCPFCGAETRPAPKPKQKRRPKGSGSIVKLSGTRAKPYLVRKGQISLGTFTTWEDANTFLSSIGRAKPESKNQTLRDLYYKYQAGPAYTRLTIGAQKNVILAWAKLEPIADRKARDLVTSDYQQMIDRANANGTGRGGCEKVKTLVSQLCREAMKDLIIDRDFGKLLTMPERVEKVRRRNFTDDEILKLFYAEDLRDARIVLVMLYTGMRIDELFSIKKTDVRLNERYMIGGEKTKAGRDRVIPIREEIYPYIVSLMGESGEYLVASPRGFKTNPKTWRTRNFYPLLDRLGIEYKDANGNHVITPHRTRHTYISKSIAAGIKPEALIKIVGHADYRTSLEEYNKEANIPFLQNEAKKGF